MRTYVRQRTAGVLDRLAAQIDRAVDDHSADAIHDVRVAIRRLSRCLRAFAQFYPGRSWKKARAELSELLHAAGAVRDRDIALELLAQAGVARRAPVIAKLKAERVKAQGKFAAALRSWRDGNRVERWRRRLEI